MSLSKMIMGQSGNQGSGAGLDVGEVFSTYLYEGNNSTQTITNGIDLDGEGGLVWIKSRSDGQSHELADTVRGNTKFLRTNSTTAERTSTSGDITAFNSSGFSLGATTTSGVNSSGNDYASWTFKKQAKFFDVVTWTGTGSAMTIDHNLGQVPGMIIVKSTSAAYDWAVWHREFTGTTDYIKLNTTAAKTDSAGVFGNGSTYLTPTSTQFFVGGNNQVSGEVGGGYVAYIFAHNNSDGGFGPADADIIKCGSYTGDGADDGPTIDLGFEPQFILSKRSDSSSQWNIVDTMRGLVTGGNDLRLYPNLTNADDGFDFIEVTPTGFKIATSGTAYNANNGTYIYMAIRRGPLAAPDDATDVFAIDTQGGGPPAYTSNFPVDFALRKDIGATGNWEALTRLLQGTSLRPNGTNVEDSGSGGDQFDYPNGYNTGTSTDADKYSWMWRRAPGYFDVVAYSGTNSATTISHNLGAVPEMIWVKSRANANRWTVFHKDQGPTKRAFLELTQVFDTGTVWNNTAPTSTVFSVGTDSNTNSSGHTFIAYLFATVAGVSKVGSYTGNGSSSGPTVDCGFSGSPRFVLIKKATGGTGSWYVFDSVRGIVAGNESQVYLNSTGAAQTATDQIDPTSSGFQIVINSGGLNTNGETYIFYAIA